MICLTAYNTQADETDIVAVKKRILSVYNKFKKGVYYGKRIHL